MQFSAGIRLGLMALDIQHPLQTLAKINIIVIVIIIDPIFNINSMVDSHSDTPFQSKVFMQYHILEAVELLYIYILYITLNIPRIY